MEQDFVDEKNCVNKDGDPQACYPPFFNAAFKRRVIASNTCGMRHREKYCHFLPTSGSHQCNYCDAKNPRDNEDHSADALTDNNVNNWWQSQNLAHNRTIHYKESVYLDIDLGARLHLAYIMLDFKSQMPKAMVIHRKLGKDDEWKPWAYYAYNCINSFNMQGRKTYDSFKYFDEVICMDDYHVPQDNKITFAIMNGRIEPRLFYTKKEFMDWASARQVRIEFKKFMTLGDEMEAKEESLITYYVAVKSLKIGARCDCNGHASDCKPVTGDRVENPEMNCQCHPSHFTQGNNCEECKPLYRDGPWKPNEPCKSK
ncbi:Laminin subunit gamma-1 [Cichlidogyrus casuarinus]|uniref:Laminin subunit gamma-1 n=1 Tax=Cichlidogyrus casuarinus TaxID=1844966 RepID=A0ABD2Q5A9_9PLAT